MQLDFRLKTAEERTALVEKIIAETPEQNLTNTYLKAMTDYILFVGDRNQTKKEKKKKSPILTKNREVTNRKRQISYEDLAAGLENGEDGIHALINQDKNQLLDYRESITEKDIQDVPHMREYENLIKCLKVQLALCDEGKKKYSLKKQIIETYQQMYSLKASYYGWPARSRVSGQLKDMSRMNIVEHITFDSNQMPQSDAAITFFNPVHISFLLTYYSALKQDSYDDLESDMRWMLIDLENLVTRTLKEEPILMSLLEYKVDGYSNSEIVAMLENEYGVTHSDQYYSTIWRKKIPKMIADQAKKDYVNWYFMEKERGNWKTCGCCGETKLAHPLFFAHNSSGDSYYSICKDCKSRKYKVFKNKKNNS